MGRRKMGRRVWRGGMDVVKYGDGEEGVEGKKCVYYLVCLCLN